MVRDLFANRVETAKRKWRDALTQYEDNGLMFNDAIFQQFKDVYEDVSKLELDNIDMRIIHARVDQMEACAETFAAYYNRTAYYVMEFDELLAAADVDKQEPETIII